MSPMMIVRDMISVRTRRVATGLIDSHLYTAALLKLIKQVMYRVGVPVAKIGSDYVRAGSAQRFSPHGGSHANGTHAGSARCFDSGRGVFDYDTLVWQDRQLPFGPPLFVQELNGMLVTIRRGLVSATRFGADDHGKLSSDAGEVQDMIDLAALGHARNSQIIVSCAILHEGNDARRNWKVILDKLTMQRVFVFDSFAHGQIVNALVGTGIRGAHKRDVIHAQARIILFVG